jgi:hypothetical protein
MNSKAYFRWPIKLVTAVVVLTSLSCSLHLGGPSPPAPRIEVKPKAASSLLRLWNTEVLDADGGDIALIIDEQQLTSYLALYLTKAEAPIAIDPQVSLRRGDIQFYGTSRGGPFTASFLISLSPGVDSDGNIFLDLTATELGPFVVPEIIRHPLSAILTEALTGRIGPIATGIRINTIAISDGEMAIVGTLR